VSEDSFVAHRSLLFTVAYDMLGSCADAEDVGAGDLAAVGSLGRSRALRGPGPPGVPCPDRDPALPEPILTSPDVAEDIELAESVSIAMLTVLETLLPTDSSRGNVMGRGRSRALNAHDGVILAPAAAELAGLPVRLTGHPPACA
jgi:hypothetical protein